MDIRQLRYFSEIVEAKSFTKAADRVRIAQPALGLQIKKLEDELGVSLLRRHSRGVEPTEAGAVLLKHANAILKQVEQAKREVTDLLGSPRGEIVIGITPTASAILATRLVRACRDAYPDVSLNIVEGLSEEIMRRLGENSLDMGFTYNPTAVTGIATEPLLTEDLYLVGPVSEGKLGETVSFAEAAKKSLILPSRGYGLRDWVENIAREKGVEIDVAFEIDSVSTMRELVEGGLGWSMLPLATVQRSVAAGIVAAAQIVKPRVSRTLHLAYAASFSENNAARAVRDAIDAVIEDSIEHSEGSLRKA
jgi:LysR family nitrogen assimilation transcriptional regulator